MRIAGSIDDGIESFPFKLDNFSEDDELGWEIKQNGIKVEVA